MLAIPLRPCLPRLSIRRRHHDRRHHRHPTAAANVELEQYGQTSTLDYVYELEGDTLTVWGGEKGSPAYYKGRFSEDGNTIMGVWTYPGGGGYESTSTRVKS
jgi:hypothetical protein